MLVPSRAIMCFTMMMKSRVFAVLVLALLVAGGLFAALRFLRADSTSTSAPEQETVTQPPIQNQKLQASYTYIATESGQIALNLLRSQAEVQTQSYGDAGDFVNSINGLAASNEYYWAFYVNNEYAERGAGQTVLEEGDVIRFEYQSLDIVRLQIDGEGNIVDTQESPQQMQGEPDVSPAGQIQ